MRVLDDDHEAKGPWDPNLDPGELQIALRWMLLNRVFDERMWQIQRQGRISFYMEALAKKPYRSRRAWRCARATCVSRPIATRACTCTAA